MIEMLSIFIPIGLMMTTISLSHAGRLGDNGKLVTYAGLLVVPAIILSGWMIWQKIGWFTILMFFACSMFIGVMHGTLMRKNGRVHLYLLQPFIACMFLFFLLACSVLAFI